MTENSKRNIKVNKERTKVEINGGNGETLTIFVNNRGVFIDSGSGSELIVKPVNFYTVEVKSEKCKI